jgi:hydrocephalus-inducing protein
MTTRKNQKQLGKAKYNIPVDIKNGPQYTIEFVANLTIPEISIDTGSADDIVDFERVCVNTRKTVKVRIENNKDVMCEWTYQHKSESVVVEESSSRNKEEPERFHVWPHSGMLLPGQKQTVDVMFTPGADKPYAQKLIFKCNKNQKQFVLNVKGQGINYSVELVPESIQLGPVLPYDNSAIQAFEIKNPMDQAIELYSLDFDKQYIEEEEILKRIDQLNPPAGVVGEPLFLPLRKPGGEFWSSVRQQDERKQQMDSIKRQIKE